MSNKYTENPSVPMDEDFVKELDAVKERRGYSSRAALIRDVLSQALGAGDLEDEVSRLEDEIESLEQQKESIEQDIKSKKALLEHKRDQLEEQREREQSAEEELEEALNTVAAYLAVGDEELDVTVAAQSSVETVLQLEDECGSVDDVLDLADERTDEIEPADYLPDQIVESTSEQDLADKYNL
jgi:chromosome segregation ATPase